MLRQFQRILYVDPQVLDGVLDLGVSEQDLDCTQVARSLLDHRSFCASQRLRAVVFPMKPDRGDPLID